MKESLVEVPEQDHYRARCAAAVDRIEREAGKQINASGSIVFVILPVESWRSIRAMLQEGPHFIPTGEDVL